MLEPVKKSEARFSKCPINDDLQLIKKRNGSVERYCIGIDISSSSHEGIHAFELFVAVLDLQCRKVKVNEIEEGKGGKGWVRVIERRGGGKKLVKWRYIVNEPAKQDQNH